MALPSPPIEIALRPGAEWVLNASNADDAPGPAQAVCSVMLLLGQHEINGRKRVLTPFIKGSHISGLYHSGEGPTAPSISGTRLRSNSRTIAPRFSTIFCQRSASPMGYCAAAMAFADTGIESSPLNPRPQTRNMATTL